MPPSSPHDRLRLLGRWIVGAPVEVARYVRRSEPIHRTHVEVPRDGEPLDATPLDGDLAEGVQRAVTGTGPEFHRTYAARLLDADLDAAGVIERFASDFAAVSPEGMTQIEAPAAGRPLEVGDELLIHLAGPWDAPVRVIDTTATSLRFATLDGHMEAGEIEFRARDLQEAGAVEFRIDSWARSATGAFAATYHPVGIGKEVQLHMWVTVLERVAEQAGARFEDGIRVITRRREAEDA